MISTPADFLRILRILSNFIHQEAPHLPYDLNHNQSFVVEVIPINSYLKSHDLFICGKLTLSQVIGVLAELPEIDFLQLVTQHKLVPWICNNLSSHQVCHLTPGTACYWGISHHVRLVTVWGILRLYNMLIL